MGERESGREREQKMEQGVIEKQRVKVMKDGERRREQGREKRRKKTLRAREAVLSAFYHKGAVVVSSEEQEGEAVMGETRQRSHCSPPALLQLRGASRC